MRVVHDLGCQGRWFGVIVAEAALSVCSIVLSDVENGERCEECD